MNVCIKVNAYSFRERNLFYFCIPSQKRSTLKGKNLLLQEQILSFESRPTFWPIFFSSRESQTHSTVNAKHMHLLYCVSDKKRPMMIGYKSVRSSFFKTVFVEMPL